MEILQQLMLGMGLAACAGLRAWLPLLGAGLLSRWGYLPLDPSLDVLKSDGALLILTTASVAEIAADKIVVLDNLLDSIGTFLRPLAGTVAAAGMLTSLDPTWQILVAVILGGGTALTVHSGKAALRGGTTVLVPAHGGLANAALSAFEDLLAIGGVCLAVLAPLLIFLFALALLILAWWFVRRIGRAGRGIRALFGRR
jgi:hypothetical protein